MQVLPPDHFTRMVFGAAFGRASDQLQKSVPTRIFHHTRPQMMYAHPVVMQTGHGYMQTPVMHPPPDRTTIKRMAEHIDALERDVRRFTEEIKIRSEISRRERKVRTALKEECEGLRDEVDRLRSVLHAREREIYDLERQLRSSESQLAMMRRRHAATTTAVSSKGTPPPGSISSLPKELRSIGTQINEIQDMESRVEQLMEALRVEKERNRRIKSLLILSSENSSSSSVPPLPMDSGRSRSQPPVRRLLTAHSLAGKIVINGPPKPRLSQQIFQGFRKDIFLPELSPPPLLLSPIKKVPNSFQIFEDKENEAHLNRIGLVASHQRPVLLDRANLAPDLISSPPKAKLLQPPPFVPPLNLGAVVVPSQPSPVQRLNTSTQSTSSEAAIKRAVAAAIEKRKQLASQGVSLGSARSSILGSSSFMSNSPMNISGVKARFCLPLG